MELISTMIEGKMGKSDFTADSHHPFRIHLSLTAIQRTCPRYAQWCDSTKSEKSSAIDEASGKVDVLKADISKAQTDAEVLAKAAGQRIDGVLEYQKSLLLG